MAALDTGGLITMVAPYVIPQISRWTDDLEIDLCAAVSDVLAKHNLNHSSDDETIGWTPEMAAEFAALLERHVRIMRLA